MDLWVKTQGKPLEKVGQFFDRMYQGRDRRLMSTVNQATSDPVNDAAAGVLRAVLAEEGVKHTVVANAMGVDPAQLSKWLRGTKGKVTVKLILAVADATDVKPGEIIERISARAKATGVRLENPGEGLAI